MIQKFVVAPLLFSVLLAASVLPASGQPAAAARVQELDAEALVQALDWTEAPGAFEQSLLRRRGNPLYPPSRREVTPEELKAAIIRDAADARQVLADFVDLALEQGRLSRLDDVDEIDQVLLRFEDAIRTAMGVGGPAFKLAAELRKLRVLLLEKWRKRSAESPRLLERIDEVRAELARDRAIAENGFVAQLLRKDGPIPQSDQASALLSEDAATIVLAMRKLDANRRHAVQRDSRAVESYVQLEGVEIDGLDARLRALSGGNPRRRPY